MFIEMKNVEFLEVAVRPARAYKIARRANHAIIIRLEGGGEYRFGEEKLLLPEGGIIFLPRGLSYSFLPRTSLGRWGIIRFDADTDIKTPVPLRAENYHALLSTFEELLRVTNLGTERHRLRAVSLLYRVFSMLAPDDDREYMDSHKLNILAPVLSYLDEHIYDSELRLDKLSKIAGVSAVYLRRIFRAYCGVTAAQYVIQARMKRAKNILEEGVESISEVAHSVGYTDPLYFSRAFKRCYDISPSALVERARGDVIDTSDDKILG